MTDEIAKGIRLLPGDMREVLATLEPESVDSVVTDPPYGLQFMGREWDKLWRNKTAADEQYVEKTRGELTSRARNLPDYSQTKFEQMIEFHSEWAAHAYRVLKPGGHLLAFGAPKNFGFMQVAIANAGFEIRDVLCWMFGSGFPKSHDVSKGIDRAAGAEREVIGPGTRHNSKRCAMAHGDTERLAGGVPDITAPTTDAAREWAGWGTALKPSYEPVLLCRKPLSEGTVAANVLKHGTGAINVDACRIENPQYDPTKTQRQQSNRQTWEGGEASGFAADHVQPTYNASGRWPANVVHDGSEEVLTGFPDVISGGVTHQPSRSGFGFRNDVDNGTHIQRDPDSGSAARFFYTAKADADDRLGSRHPTVKPVDLMQWLVRLVTPKGGTVLDCFAGTGTTGEAAFREGMRAILIEREEEYQADIRRRMQLCLSGPDERRRETIKHKTKDDPEDHGPLFG